MKHKFKSVQYMTAKEKRTVLAEWIDFLKHDCAREHFKRALYNHLTLHCDFIAHYDLDGFYSDYFILGSSTKTFLSQFDKRGPCRSVEFMHTGFFMSKFPPWGSTDCDDINLAMIEEGAIYIPKLIEKAEEKQIITDVKRAADLMRKHSIKSLKIDGDSITWEKSE